MNNEQQVAFDTVKSGKSVFITGSAGTGKSFTLNAIVDYVRHCTQKIIGITSSTGVSAINIKGRTLHSFLGIGLARQSAYSLYAKNKKKSISKMLNQLHILIIDEISMISDELFGKISEYLSLMRKNKAPFGGLQMILCGDMCQLPPVEGDYCFKSSVWEALNPTICFLKLIVRQEKDELFKKILEDARFGQISDDNLHLLRSKHSTVFGEIRPTILHSKNVNVDIINELEYKKLINGGADEHIFKTEYVPDNEDMRMWGKINNIPEELKLCAGAQVMITANINVECGIANGTRGMITGFTANNEPIIVTKSGEQIIIEPFVFSEDEDFKKFISAIPLKLAYALTIHKSQSCTLDAVVLDLGHNIFEYGQAYTALSRVRDLDSVRMTNIRKDAFKVHPDIIKFYS